ncbi:hypothetical protein GOV03_03375 [Candidatus Woesearchaeota archaeon]|nr:hypothetical protein [Candidatus Woesearchaeota archaeon]
MLQDKVVEEFLKLNPKVKEDELVWRADGRLEWKCKHGVGHTVYELKQEKYIHGCDGCCKAVKPYNPTEPDEHDDWADEYGRGT